MLRRGRGIGRRRLSAAPEVPTWRIPYIAALAAMTVLALGLRAAYGWRLGIAPHAWSIVASALVTPVVAALAARKAGAAAGLTAGAAWTFLPAGVVAGVCYPQDTYAACAGALALLAWSGAGGRRNAATWFAAAGALAGAAVAFRLAALALPAYFLGETAYRLASRERPPGSRFFWLPGFAVFLIAAAALEVVHTRSPWGHVANVFAAGAEFYPNATSVIKRVFADAAAMLFWDPLGFGALVTFALAGVGITIAGRRGDLRPYAFLLVGMLLAFSFVTPHWRPYAPAILEPRRWLLAAIPAAVLAGGAVGPLWRAEGSPATLRFWAGSFGLSYVLAVLFVNGNMPFAVVSFAALSVAAVAALALAALTTRRPGAAALSARLAAVTVISLLAVPALTLFI